jgi:hypothetical protein
MSGGSMTLLGFLAVALVLGQEPAPAAASRPAVCVGFRSQASESLVVHPKERSPYPPIGMPWPVDLSKAQIVKDRSVAERRSHYFPPLSLQQVREALTLYVVVSRDDWDHYSHVGSSDEGGWIADGKDCYQWTIRPGGLAWIVYPDGTAVYLASCPVERPTRP